LKGDIERTKADLAHSEKSWNTAEVTLSLQNAQHKREMTELERELSAFRSMPNLEQALTELEERNSEMEELFFHFTTWRTYLISKFRMEETNDQGRVANPQSPESSSETYCCKGFECRQTIP
jgi:hypothetical protein